LSIITMTARELREEYGPLIREIASLHGAANVRVFGSVARNAAGPHSDVDFLVDLAPDRSLLDLGGLLMDLQELLHRRVDVMTESGLRPAVRASALREAVKL
jgi:uncharacterized protein